MVSNIRWVVYTSIFWASQRGLVLIKRFFFNLLKLPLRYATDVPEVTLMAKSSAMALLCHFAVAPPTCGKYPPILPSHNPLHETCFVDGVEVVGVNIR